MLEESDTGKVLKFLIQFFENKELREEPGGFATFAVFPM